jgi:lysophospholipase L1-like esterase
MTKRINMNINASVQGGVGIGLMTSAGNPWTVSDDLATDLVMSRRLARFVDAQPAGDSPVSAGWKSGVRIGIATDSIENNNNDNNFLTGASNITYQERTLELGWFTHLNTLLNGRFLVVKNAAVAGAQSPAFMAQLQDLIAQGIESVLLGAPTNDPLNGISAQQSKDNMLALFRAALAAGLTVYGCSYLANNAFANDAGYRARIADYNRWLYQLCMSTQGMEYVDLWKPTVDFASATGDRLASRFIDGAHPNGAGALYIAQSVYADGSFDRFSRGSYVFSYSPVDVVGANNPSGNWNPNPLMNGTGVNLGQTGGATDFGVVAGTTNIAPNGWRARVQEAFGGALATAVQVRQARVARAGLPDRWQFTVDFPSQASRALFIPELQLQALPATVAAGNTVEFAVALEYTELTTVGGISMFLEFMNAANARIGYVGRQYADFDNSLGIWKGVVRSRGVIPATATQFRVWLAHASRINQVGKIVGNVDGCEIRVVG